MTSMPGAQGVPRLWTCWGIADGFLAMECFGPQAFGPATSPHKLGIATTQPEHLMPTIATQTESPAKKQRITFTGGITRDGVMEVMNINHTTSDAKRAAALEKMDELAGGSHPELVPEAHTGISETGVGIGVHAPIEEDGHGPLSVAPVGDMPTWQPDSGEEGHKMGGEEHPSDMGELGEEEHPDEMPGLCSSSDEEHPCQMREQESSAPPASQESDVAPLASLLASGSHHHDAPSGVPDLGAQMIQATPANFMALLDQVSAEDVRVDHGKGLTDMLKGVAQTADASKGEHQGETKEKHPEVIKWEQIADRTHHITPTPPPPHRTSHIGEARYLR